MDDEALREALKSNIPPEAYDDYREYMAFKIYLGYTGMTIDDIGDSDFRQRRENLAAKDEAQRGEAASLREGFLRSFAARNAILESMWNEVFEEKREEWRLRRMARGEEGFPGKAKYAALGSGKTLPFSLGAMGFENASKIDILGDNDWSLTIVRDNREPIGFIDVVLRGKEGRTCFFPINTSNPTCTLHPEDLMGFGIDVSDISKIRVGIQDYEE